MSELQKMTMPIQADVIKQRLISNFNNSTVKLGEDGVSYPDVTFESIRVANDLMMVRVVDSDNIPIWINLDHFDKDVQAEVIGKLFTLRLRELSEERQSEIAHKISQYLAHFSVLSLISDDTTLLKKTKAKMDSLVNDILDAIFN
jgi:hypothetical protein